jgi:LytS/YehU family sensor histidine kinase
MNLAFTKLHKYLTAILLPPVILFVNYFLFGDQYFSNPKYFGIATLITLPLVGASFAIQGTIAGRSLKKYPSIHDTPKRIVILLSINALVTALMISFIFWLYDALNILGYTFEKANWIRCLIAGFISTLINMSLYETVGFFQWTKASELQAEQLRKEQLQSQFDSLKEQVNPHFLFNSLNSLSSLIATDPNKAEQFVEEMSTVYRYLLRSNEEQLTTLQKEVEFIESYNLLLKTRFGNGFQPTTRIEEKMKEYLLPPMTLQMLVENAVKHNIVDPDTPLRVELYTQDGKLIVRNNLQRKNKSVVSNKIGLSNIISKYRLLNCPDIEIEETAGEFTVVLPLIKNTH